MHKVSDSISRVEKVTNELNNVLELFNNNKNPSDEVTVTTSNGRTYKVAYVLETEKGNWKITNLVSRGMFVCDKCDIASKYHVGDAWLQFIHDASVVRMHSSLIHFFKNHPAHVPPESLEKVATVFIE